MAQILHCLQDLLPYESKATFWKSWETSFFLPNYDISVILFFFPCFLGAFHMSNANPRRDRPNSSRRQTESD